MNHVTKIALSAALSAATYGAASAAPWCHARLTASDGTAVGIDYQVRFSDLSGGHNQLDGAIMDNSHIHVYAGPKDFVALRFASVETTTEIQGVGGYGIEPGWFRRDATKHTVRLADWYPFAMQPRIVTSPGKRWYRLYKLELGVSVNGRPLIDPVTGQPKFKFFPAAYNDYCPNPG